MNAQNPTVSQCYILTQIMDAGWVISKMERIGRKVWIEAEPKDKMERGLARDAFLYGGIGDYGSLDLTFCVFMDTQKIDKLCILMNRLKD